MHEEVDIATTASHQALEGLFPARHNLVGPLPSLVAANSASPAPSHARLPQQNEVVRQATSWPAAFVDVARQQLPAVALQAAVSRSMKLCPKFEAPRYFGSVALGP